MKTIKEKFRLQLIPEIVFNQRDSICDSVKNNIKGFSKDCLMEVVSIVATHTRKDEGETPLHTRIIRRLVPQGDKYLKELVKAGIVQRSGNAVKGKTSYLYSFAPKYYSRFKTVRLTNQKLIHRINTVYKSLKNESIKTARRCTEQIKYLDRLELAEEYSEFIEANYTAGTEQYNSIVASANRIINKSQIPCIDRTSGRFHSVVTNMPKGLRPYLRINGESLVNIDVKNCQPYLSTIILTFPAKVSWLTENPAFAMLLQTLKVSINQDVINFINLVANGDFYEFLMAEFAKEGLILSRQETKVQVLRILFARNRLPKNEINRKARLVFKNRFPTVHRIFSKVRGAAKGDKFANFKRFAILLQRIEAYIMLEVIMKRIFKELPGVIAITIHDSIMTGILTDKKEEVRAIMIEEFTKFVGFAPKIQTNCNRNKGKEEEEEERRKEEEEAG